MGLPGLEPGTSSNDSVRFGYLDKRAPDAEKRRLSWVFLGSHHEGVFTTIPVREGTSRRNSMGMSGVYRGPRIPRSEPHLPAHLHEQLVG